jgi:uncharacterized repeat protein (TIGR03803 family)
MTRLVAALYTDSIAAATSHCYTHSMEPTVMPAILLPVSSSLDRASTVRRSQAERPMHKRLRYRLRVSTSGRERVLHGFTFQDGAFPHYGCLIIDRAGSLYGTTQFGGSPNLGTVFKMTHTGQITALHIFTGGSTDGSCPFVGVTMSGHGDLFGTTAEGGTSAFGTVFRVVASGHESIVFNFPGGMGQFPRLRTAHSDAANLDR